MTRFKITYAPDWEGKYRYFVGSTEKPEPTVETDWTTFVSFNNRLFAECFLKGYIDYLNSKK